MSAGGSFVMDQSARKKSLDYCSPSAGFCGGVPETS